MNLKTNRQFHRVLNLLGYIALAHVCLMHADAQTYTIETSTFRLVFNRFNSGGFYATGLREVRYLPTGRLFNVSEAWTNIANVDSSWWDDPDSVSVVQVTPSVQDITIHYGPGKRSTMRVTSHPHFVEFQLTDVTGNCGDIRMFGPIFLSHNGPFYCCQYQQLLPLGNGYYSFLTTANANTGIWRWTDGTVDMHHTTSPRYVPSVGPYLRDQRFAYFICREEDLPQRVREVEAYFGYAYGWSLKERPENNIDYLFVLDLNTAMPQDIINLCRQTNLGAVLLAQWVWSDWQASDEPFKLRPYTTQLINNLKAAGLVVGLHSYVHKVPENGYYATHYPGSVSTTSLYGFKAFRFSDTLPELMASQYATKVNSLDADWLYFDGQESLYEVTNQHISIYDWYLTMRITAAIMNKLRMRNHPLKIFQCAGEGSGGYHYVSRYGQTDYWDTGTITPIGQMNEIVSLFTPYRFALGAIDLGWFGREIHIPSPPYRRDARWDEWLYLASTSLTHNIPIGIRTTYTDFMTDPLRDSVVVLLRETIRQRRGLVGVPVSVKAGWNMISNPVTTTADSLRQLFPSSLLPYAFSYDSSGSYAQSHRLFNGTGYWARFPSSETTILNGTRRLIDTVRVRNGWNMIGSISEPIAAAQITSIPPGTVTSQFFGFVAAGYTQFDTIQPGKGYWVKVTTDAMLVLAYQQADTASRIRIVPISELPPDAPSVKGVSSDELRLLRFVLGQNYPNPFNPSTQIHFELPQDGSVRLVVYDLLGREVATLMNEFKKAGRYDVTFAARNLASGVYFYRLQAGAFNDVKKLLLLR
jgi:hypothetical protein